MMKIPKEPGTGEAYTCIAQKLPTELSLPPLFVTIN